MKNFDYIISRFDDIQDLSVSEEMLGAYLEGNLDSYEMENISKMLQEDLVLRTISEDIMLSPLELNNNDLLNVEMENDITVSGAENDAAFNTDYHILGSDENNMGHESYIENYDSIEDNDFIDNNESVEDSLFDDSTFELPEIPFF